ncbi:MAG: hypothetical protein QF664_10780 [Dehalococcoidia bacterium]|jgi:hypothetical protein|nr:hypothetical protein [Dehalococcoidia bacterium]
MVRAIEGTCTVGIGLLRHACGRDAVASCVYCGRPFCESHGERRPDHADSCSRRACRRKQRDVQSHLEWKQRVYESNRVSVCAQEDCGERMRHQCSRCRLMFCEEHVESLPIVSTSSGTDARGVVCEHCRARRRVWE